MTQLQWLKKQVKVLQSIQWEKGFDPKVSEQISRLNSAIVSLERKERS